MIDYHTLVLIEGIANVKGWSILLSRDEEKEMQKHTALFMLTSYSLTVLQLIKIGNHARSVLVSLMEKMPSDVFDVYMGTGPTVETWRAASLQHPPSELKTGKHTALFMLTSYT